MSSMVDWALYYARLGWAVFPLVPGTKSPFKGTHGSSEATTDPEQIRAWWAANPHANIGTRPSAAGLYVYDVDPRNGGDTDHERLQAAHGAIASPLRVNSPSGGWHLYFAAPPGQRYDGKPADGIDGKYNGYAVLPPSIHPNGGRYAWATGTPGASTAAAPIPAFLIRQTVTRKRAEVPGNIDDVAKITEALDRLDPDDYHQWTEAMASVKHWEDTGGDELAGVGYEVLRQWSARSAKHDDGAFEDKWHTWDSYRSNARTLGSLLHDAGMTAAQQMVDAASAFAAAPAEQQSMMWTEVPVPRFKGSLDPSEVLAELHANNRFGFSEHFAAGRWVKVIGAVVWAVGGSCAHALQVLTAAGLDDTIELRGLIAADAARRTTWKTVYALNAEQQALAAQGIMAELAVDDGVLDQALRHILSTLPAIPGMFQRGHQLCRVMDDGRIEPHDVDTLSGVLERYLRMIKGAKGAPTKCPEGLARRVIRARQYHGVPVLKAVVNLPVARADGSIHNALGLDESTGLYLQGVQHRDPRYLSPAERSAVFGRIWSFEGFPFATQADRSCYFAALLTTAIRPTIETAPAFLINTSTPGTGKTKLAECLMIAADASKAAKAFPDEPEEQAKVISSVLKAAPRGVLFDNVIGTIKPTGAFCVASTSAEYEARVMGTDVMQVRENRAVWVLTGNNVRLAGDVVRRVLAVTLDAPENPEFRRFSFDPVLTLERSATDLRLALLDLIYTWDVDGKPYRDVIGGFASFEPWSQIVRPVCMWGLGDPLDVIGTARDLDPASEKLELMMDAWEKRFGLNEPVFLKDIGLSAFIGEHAGLWKEAEEAICMYKGRVDLSQLPYWLRKNKGIKNKGRYFEGVKKGPRTAWKLSKL